MSSGTKVRQLAARWLLGVLGKPGFVFLGWNILFPVGVEISVAVQGSRTVHLLALGGFRKHKNYLELQSNPFLIKQVYEIGLAILPRFCSTCRLGTLRDCRAIRNQASSSQPCSLTLHQPHSRSNLARKQWKSSLAKNAQNLCPNDFQLMNNFPNYPGICFIYITIKFRYSYQNHVPTIHAW